MVKKWLDLSVSLCQIHISFSSVRPAGCGDDAPPSFTRRALCGRTAQHWGETKHTQLHKRATALRSPVYHGGGLKGRHAHGELEAHGGCGERYGSRVRENDGRRDSRAMVSKEEVRGEDRERPYRVESWVVGARACLPSARKARSKVGESAPVVTG